jgi:F-type H+-transporting ATPase subunit b
MINLKNLCLISCILIASVLASAHEAGGEPNLGPHELSTLKAQIFNVVLMFAGLVYFVRKPIKAFFAEKRTVFLEVAQKAQAAKEDAIRGRMEIEVRLSKLQSTTEESISRARAEAAELKNQLILEAQALSLRMRAEAQATAKHELERAKQNLRIQMISGAKQMAQAELEKKLTPEDQKRLEGEFITGLQEVRP